MKRLGKHQVEAQRRQTRLWVLTLPSLLVLFGMAVCVVPKGPAGASGTLPPADPPQNVAAQLNIRQYCGTTIDNAADSCNQAELHNINFARSIEGVPSMVLPTNYSTLTVAQQNLTVTNLERGDRGLSQFTGLSSTLNTSSQTAVPTNADPLVPVAYQFNQFGSNFALDQTLLASDFGWMYDDGLGGHNGDCTVGHATGCWGHRNNILGQWQTTGGQTMEMGSGNDQSGGGGNGRYTQSFANETGTADAQIDPYSAIATFIPSQVAPDVLEVRPSSSSTTSAGTTITVEGNYFSRFGAPTVAVGGVAATNVHVNWDGELTAQVPAQPAGSNPYGVTVTTPAGTSDTTPTPSVNEFTYAAAGVPSISSVSPNSAPVTGDTTHTITISGSNLCCNNLKIRFGSNEWSSGSFAANSSTITVTGVPPALASGTVDVTVSTDAGTSEITANDHFTYTAIGAPTVTSVSSASGPSTGGTSVTIGGTNFIGLGSVSFGGVPATAFTVNDAGTSISATSPAGAAGTVDVVVSAEGGTSATNANDQFTYTAQPTVTSVVPNSGSTTGGGSVTINGTNFAVLTSVTFGGVSATTNNVTLTAISVLVPAHTAATVDVVVTSPGGSSPTSANDHYTYVLGLPPPTTPTISNLPVSDVFGGGFTAAVATTGDGTKSVTSNSPAVCTVAGFVVSYVAVGSCSLTAHVAQGATKGAADGSPQAFAVGPGTPTTPTISGLPVSGVFAGGFTATVATNGDGTKSVTSNSLGICTTSGLDVSYVGIGTCSLTAHVGAGTNYNAADGGTQTIPISRATPTAPAVSNLPSSGVFGGGFTATVSTSGDGTLSVTSNSTGVCTVAGLVVTYVGLGTCSLTAHVAQGPNFLAANGGTQTFLIGQATPTAAISNLPPSGILGGGFTATVATSGDGTKSVTSNSTGVCTVAGFVVTYVGAGNCSLTAHVAAGTNYTGADGSAQTFVIGPAPPSTPTISNLPASGIFGGNFTATVATNGDGTKSVTSNSTGVCTVAGLVVTYVGVGTCSLTAHVAAGTNYTAANGNAQTFAVNQAVPSTPTISNLPGGATIGGSFAATVSTTGDGARSLTSNSPGICTVSGLVVAFVAVGTCSLTSHVGTGTNYSALDGTAQTFAIAPPHGYWLVGSDGGIFTFGTANFFGSTGSLKLQRPVVGITPTAPKLGYWLVASDGGIFAFGDAPYLGSIPGLNLAPAGTKGGKHLNAPIVGMVPSASGAGYFMVGADGGVFAFGDAVYEGSCPGIGSCSGAAVGVAPDASGAGYWLVTANGAIYTFGDAQYFGAPGPQGSVITSIVRTPDGKGYWVLDANGTVFAYGDAINLGDIAGQAGGSNPASAIFTTSDGAGYWVATALGRVFSFGDAPNDGDMSGTQLNGSIIAATGY